MYRAREKRYTHFKVEFLLIHHEQKNAKFQQRQMKNKIIKIKILKLKLKIKKLKTPAFR
jgi:hypothetical protein